MNDEIKVGDMVRDIRFSDGPLVPVIGVHENLLWLRPHIGHTIIGYADRWRKAKAPTPCPETWANVDPTFVSWYSTREAADRYASPRRIGVLHLSPNGDCEFIRTEEL